MSRQRVLFISSCFPSRADPVSGIFVRRQASEIQKLGWEVKVIAPTPWLPVNIKKITAGRWPDYNQVPSTDVIENIDVTYARYFWIPRLRLHASMRYTYAASVIQTARSLREVYPFDLIHGHMLYPEGWIATRLAKEFHLPSVVTSHGSDALPQPIPGYRQLLSQVLASTQQVIAVSQSQKRRILAFATPTTPIQVVYNGYDHQMFYPDRAWRNWLTTRMGIQDSRRVGLFVGALQPEKGIYELIQAYRCLQQDYPDFILIFVGEGRSHAGLEAVAKDLIESGSVFVIGRVPAAEVARWMNGADFLILPSYSEGFPCVVTEAMACGLPVAATEVGGTGELVMDGQTGFLAQPRQVDSLVSALRKLLNLSTAERQAMGMLAREKVSALRWQDNAETMNRIYQEVLL